MNAVTIKEERYVEISNRFEALEDINDSENINHKQGLKNIKENIKSV